MAGIIEGLIKHSLGEANYDRVIEALGTMREELVDYEEPALYNHFLAALKGKILGEELGGDRKELWWLVRKSKLGLIDQATSEVSKVTEQEAKEVSPQEHNGVGDRQLISYSSSLLPELPGVILSFRLELCCISSWSTHQITITHFMTQQSVSVNQSL